MAFEVDGEDADVVAYEPVWIDDKVQGFCTSGGYSHFADKSIALALIPRAYAHDADLSAEIDILGKRYAARRLMTPLFDPNGDRMRQKF